MDTNQPEKYRRYHRYFVDVGQLYQKKKARVYTSIVLSIFTSAFFLFFAIRPTLTTIASLIKEIKDKRVIAAKLQDKITALNSAQIEYQKIEKDFYLIDESLPQHPNISLLVLQLETLARKSSVSVEAIQFEKTILKGKEEKKSVNFSLAVAGDYKNLKSFLGSLIRLRRLVLIDTFAFKTSPTEENLILSLNAQAHYLKHEQ